jgi:hypothetical protein
MNSISDVMIHINEPLSVPDRERMENRMRDQPGVIAARFNPGKEHLLVVAFDPVQVRPATLLAQARDIGYTAQLVGA